MKNEGKNRKTPNRTFHVSSPEGGETLHIPLRTCEAGNMPGQAHAKLNFGCLNRTPVVNGRKRKPKTKKRAKAKSLLRRAKTKKRAQTQTKSKKAQPTRESTEHRRAGSEWPLNPRKHCAIGPTNATQRTRRDETSNPSTALRRVSAPRKKVCESTRIK